jgi:hypothetical protein
MLIPRRRRGQTENESSTTYQDEEANIAAVMNGVEEAEKMGPMPTLAFTGELYIYRSVYISMFISHANLFQPLFV